MNADEIATEQLKLQKQELELKQAALAAEFAKFGFRGTLAAGIAGLIFILALAALDAYSPDFNFGATGVIATSFLLVVGTVLFGAFSTRQPMKMLATYSDKIRIETATGGVDAETREKEATKQAGSS